jgi:hypothetical protein
VRRSAALSTPTEHILNTEQPAALTLSLLENIQQSIQQLEDSDRESFTLFVAALVRTVVNAGGVVGAVSDLKKRLAESDVHGAAAIVESIEQWLNGIEARWTMLETRYVM